MNAFSHQAFVTDYTVAAEIEALAWKLMACDIEQGSDEMKLASDYADQATEQYEDEAEAPFGSTSQNIVRLVRQSLLARIKQEIRNRDFAFDLEYTKRRRSGMIDANGCGELPTW